MPPRISLRDIARATGYSHSTISLALRHHHSIPPVTREKVEAVARKLGYASDPELASLMSRYRSKASSRYQETIAFLNTWPDPEALSRYYSGTWTGALERAQELGFKLENFHWPGKSMTARRVSSILVARNIRGIILPPQPRARRHINLDWKHFAVVAIGYSIAPSTFHMVASEQYRASYMAMRHLRHLGYRRIGFADHEKTSERTDHNFLGGYLVQQRHFKASEQMAPFLFKAAESKTFEFSAQVEGRIKQQLARWIERGRPEVVLYHFPPIGNWIRELGYKVPEQIGLAHFNAHPSTLNNSGMILLNDHLGAMAVEVLSGLLQRAEFGIPDIPIRHLVPYQWNEGTCLRRRHATGK